jgi:hypothetical protein
MGLIPGRIKTLFAERSFVPYKPEGWTRPRGIKPPPPHRLPDIPWKYNAPMPLGTKRPKPVIVPRGSMQ